MKYECKIVVRYNWWWNNDFDIYIKYKPYGNKLYNPFIKQISIISDREYSFNSIFECKVGKELVDHIEEFNNMSTKQLIETVTNHIKDKEGTNVKNTDDKTRFKNATTNAKQKANTFIVEVK